MLPSNASSTYSQLNIPKILALFHGSAAHSPIAASITALPPATNHPANWKPPITELMLPSNASSTYSQLNIPKILALFLSTIHQGRI